MIELKARPDLRATLQAAIDILQAVRPLGAEAMTAIERQNIRILCLTDEEMNDLSGINGSACYATLQTGERFICLRQSILENSNLSYKLLRDISHEAIHCLQDRKFPAQFAIITNGRHPDCNRN